jgi:plasmid replication initiation protein
MEKRKLVLVETDGNIPKNAVVAKDHALIEKMADLNLQELRLIAFCVAHLDSREGATNKKKITAKVTDLAHIFPMDEKSAYGVIKRAIKDIGKKPMEFSDGKKLYLWNWFTGLTYETGLGQFEFVFNPDLDPFLLGLKEKLSMYRLYEVPFKSSITWLLFENLNCRLFKGKWTVELDELRKLLGVSGKYKEWRDLKKRCIDEPLAEIKLSSNIKAEYKGLKTGNKTTSVKFTISKNRPHEPQDKIIEVENPVEYIYESLLSVGVKQGHADTIIKLLAQSQSGKNIEIRDKIDGIVKRSKGKANRAGYVYKSVVSEIKQGNITDAIPNREPPATPQLNTPMAEKTINKAMACYKDKNGHCPTRDSGYTNKDICGRCFDIFPLKENGLK